MHRNLSKNTKLLVISDTGIVKDNETYKAFGPVVVELENLLSEFEYITWIGFERNSEIDNQSYINVQNKKIRVILLKEVGGRGFKSKLDIIRNYPAMFKIILKEVKKNKYIHTRAPSNPAVIAMLLSLFFSKKKFWHKYAGTWTDKASFFYEIQRFILKKMFKNSIITINGKSSSRKKNILTFENPCLTEKDIKEGLTILENKKNNDASIFCFVGNLTHQKGVDLILKALKVFPKNKINTFHFVGGGKLKSYFIEQAKNINIEIIFHGYLPKNEIVNIYAKSNFIVLPSKSEGFPKVIGEAMNFGCIPIVSDISCISEYVKDSFNGFLINPVTVKSLISKINKALELSYKSRYQIIKNNNTLATKFTYKYYNKRVREDIFKLKEC